MNLKSLLLLIPVGLIPLLHYSAFTDPVLIPKFAMFSVFLTLSYLVLGITLFLKKTSIAEGILQRPLPLVYFLFLLYSVITVTYSLNPVDGLFEALKMTTMFAYFVLLCLWVRDPERGFTYFRNVILILSVAVVGIGIYQFTVIHFSLKYSFENSYLITGTFAHRNLYSQILLLTIPMLVHESFSGSIGRRLLALFLLIFSTGFVVILYVRTVWVSLAAAAVVTSFAYLLWERKRARTIFSLVSRSRAAIVLFSLLLVLMLSIGYTGLRSIHADRYIRDQVQSMTIFNYGSVGDRLKLWDKSIELIREQPLKGVGLGSWKIAFLQKGTEGLKSEDSVTFYQRPHNDLLWVLSEEGIAGFLLYSLLFLLMFYWLVRLIRHEPAAVYKSLNYTFLAVLTCYFCISLFSFPRERYTHTVILTALMALITLQYHHYFPFSGKIRPLGRYAVLLLALLMPVLLVYGLKRAAAEQAFNIVLQHRKQQNWTALIRDMEKVDQEVYNMDYTSTPVAWYAGLARIKLDSLAEAAHYFRKALELNPYHIHALNNLGSVYYRKGEEVKAVNCFRRALKIQRTFKEANLNMAVIHYNYGRLDSAIYFMQQIDTACIDPRYREYVKIMVRERVKELEEGSDDDFTRQMLNNMYHNWEWLSEMFKKSAAEKEDFTKMVDRNVYYMRHEDWFIQLKEELTKYYVQFRK